MKEIVYNLLSQEDKCRGGDLLRRQIEIAGLKAKRDAALEAEKHEDNIGISFPKSADINRQLEFESNRLKKDEEFKREIEEALDWYVREFMK